MSLRARVVLAAFVSTFITTPAIAQSSPGPNFEIAGQTTLLRLSDSDSTNVGVGGRFSWDFSRFASADAEGALDLL